MLLIASVAGGLYTILMSIFIGADHRGFELKNKIIDYLQSKNTRVEDMGNYEHDPDDDYPDFTNKVAKAVLQNPEAYLGIVICGSGVGVSIAANRHRHIQSALGFNEDQVKHARTNDHVNVLALPSDYIDFEKAKMLVDTFIESKPDFQDRFIRRVAKMNKI